MRYVGKPAAGHLAQVLSRLDRTSNGFAGDTAFFHVPVPGSGSIRMGDNDVISRRIVAPAAIPIIIAVILPGDHAGCCSYDCDRSFIQFSPPPGIQTNVSSCMVITLKIIGSMPAIVIQDLAICGIVVYKLVDRIIAR